MVDFHNLGDYQTIAIFWSDMMVQVQVDLTETADKNLRVLMLEKDIKSKPKAIIHILERLENQTFK
jgi:hypothetical protein